MRIDQEDSDCMILEEAEKELKHLELLQPENIYKIEECDVYERSV